MCGQIVHLVWDVGQSALRAELTHFGCLRISSGLAWILQAHFFVLWELWEWRWVCMYNFNGL